MSERAKPPTQPPASSPSRTYKRSWKNLLINKRYQLRFTLFMAGLAGVLMTGLGYWVMFYADRTTTIGINRVISEPCPTVPKIDRMSDAVGAPAAAPDPAPAPEPAPAPAPAPEVDEPTAVEPDPTTGTDGDHPRPRVTIEQSTLVITERAPPDFAAKATARWRCELRHAGAVANLKKGRTQILLVLIGAGLLLVLGLGVYGIKMTHKVAGPLYKLTLYFAKMRDGRLDRVYNLRKGDQLVEFYEHFKSAHNGVVAMEHADIDRLKALLAIVDKDPATFDTPELTERIAELRAIVARKEKSLE
jgi:hypothetical protein